MRQTILDMEAVSKALNKSAKHSLQIEVITYALYEMRDNPEFTVEEALDYALAEWDI